mgnify:CR=1 FL=1
MVAPDIGKTAEGRTQLMAIVTSPENHKKLARYQGDLAAAGARRGADRRPGARAREGRQGGRLDRRRPARDRDARRAAARRDGLPDGQPHRRGDDAVPERRASSCSSTPTRTATISSPTGTCATTIRKRRSPNGLPRSYQKYIGHDNNRDFFASTQAETENINRVLYHEWFPQILYNHHQSGPAGTVVWSSPQRDPYNYNLDPLLVLGPRRRSARTCTSGWRPRASRARRWRRAARMTAGGTAASGTPANVPQHHRDPDRDDRQPDADARSARAAAADSRPRPAVSDRAAGVALPAVDRLLGHRSTAACSTTRRATARTLLFNIYRMGQARDRARQPRLRGRRRRSRIDARRGDDRAAAGERSRRRRPRQRRGPSCASRSCAIRAATSSRRTSRDFPTATKFINALRRGERHRPSRDGGVHGAAARRYPAGSFVVMTGAGVPSARDGHVRAAGSSGRSSRIPARRRRRRTTTPAGRSRSRWACSSTACSTAVTGPFEKVTDWNVKPPAATMSGAAHRCFIDRRAQRRVRRRQPPAGAKARQVGAN